MKINEKEAEIGTFKKIKLFLRNLLPICSKYLKFHNLSRRLGEVVTFNSPGIAPLLNFNGFAIGANTFKKELAGPTTHYITSPDPVSLGGLKYIDGSATLVDYNANRLYFLGR